MTRLQWRSTNHRGDGRTTRPAAARLSDFHPLRAKAFRQRRMLALVAAVVALLALAAPQARGQAELTLLDDMVLDSDALLMPTSAPYGRAINGLTFQSEALLTYNGYQYASWYHAGSDEDLYVACRSLSGTTWESFDTGENLNNGDGTPSDHSYAWDAHNVVSMGVSGDGRMHFAWDHHNSELNYFTSGTGVTTSPGGTWDSGILNSDRNSLNVGGPVLPDVTYPCFVTKPNGDMILTFRVGISGNGNLYLATYQASTGLWDAPHQIINGTNSIAYTDPVNTSYNRNAYLNGLHIGPDGNIQITWTWREEATGGSNHDIMYAYSEDGGDTWRNNAGTVVGSAGSPMDLNSPGITVVTMDRTNTLMNQQTQTVDGDGRVHAVMWHKRDGEPPQTNPPFTTAPAAYFHYFRDPDTGDWTRRDLPTTRDVGRRPDVAFDQDNNLYVAYISPGPGDGVGVKDYYTDGDLIIAGATKAANYADWSILLTDTRDFAGEPFIDQNRLLEDGILAVFIQENDDINTGRTATPLHVLEYDIYFPTPGDVDGDGDVDMDDFDAIQTHLFDSVTLRSEGDLNGDGIVDFSDFRQWKANFPYPGAGAGAAWGVPEPTSALLLAVGGLLALASKRRTGCRWPRRVRCR